MSNPAYKWTNKQLPVATRASGFEAGAGKNDASRQLERLKAENADLVKTVMGLKEEMRTLVESLKADSGKKGKRADKPDAGGPTD